MSAPARSDTRRFQIRSVLIEVCPRWRTFKRGYRAIHLGPVVIGWGWHRHMLKRPK